MLRPSTYFKGQAQTWYFPTGFGGIMHQQLYVWGK